ncbi:aminoacyl-tRNA hydrolase [Neolewinella persica]|uniref:aminoacyl-tRNA hydrolase n=1 Tax=Neolewinella persica TaxID=70998 RepID=UPI0003A21111|nr:aminoacyl-tRNA hydrolase [Neolewinella persica]
MLKLLRRLFGANDRPAPEPIDPTMKFLIVGLGNPGPKYENTRHNVGFRVLEHLSEDFRPCSHGHMARIKHRGKQVLLLKPDTFMNLSGKAVRYWMQAEKIPKENVLVVVDDLHLDFAQLRLRGKGSDAGHNGLKSIDQLTGGNNYARLRCGIGKDFHPGQQADYVLGEWNATERKGLPELIETAAKMSLSFCGHGLQNTMSKFNQGKAKKEKKGKKDEEKKPVKEEGQKGGKEKG